MKVNDKEIGNYSPKELSFKYTPGMKLSDVQRREFTEAMKGRRGVVYTMNVKKGKTYNIDLKYQSGKEGSVSRLSVDMYERKLAVFDKLKEKMKNVEAIIYVGGITPIKKEKGTNVRKLSYQTYKSVS